MPKKKPKLERLSFLVEFDDGTDIKVRFQGFDKKGNPIVLDQVGNKVKKDTKIDPDAEELFSFHYKNPCWIRVNGRPKKIC